MKDIKEIVAALRSSGYSSREAQEIIAGGPDTVKAAMAAPPPKKWSKPRPCETCGRYANPDRCPAMCAEYRAWFGNEWHQVQAMYGITHSGKRSKAPNGERAAMIGNLHARGLTDTEIADALDLSWGYVASVRRQLGLAPNKARKEDGTDA